MASKRAFSIGRGSGGLVGRARSMPVRGVPPRPAPSLPGGGGGAVTETPVVPVTSGFNQIADWDNRVTNYTDMLNIAACSVRMTATISDSDTGILMESGATGFGCMAYVFGGILYVSAGVATGTGEASDRAECEWSVPAGSSSYLVEWSCVTGGNLVLYIDGVQVDISSIGTAAQIAGSNAGGIEQAHLNVAVNRGGWTADGEGDFSGTLDECLIFDDVTAETAGGK